MSRRAEARTGLMAAAGELIEARQWAGVTIQDLTAAAGLSRTAFYQHFDDREDLLIAMLSELGPELHQTGGQWLDGGTAEDPVAVHRRGLTQLVALFVRHGRVLKAVSDLAPIDARVGDAWQALTQAIVDATTAAIRRDVRAGRSDVTDPAQMSRALSATTRHYLLVSFGQRPFARRAQVSETLVRIWTHTLYGSLPTTGVDAAE
ncbi:TetR/AcrR family transcriptional regulator [Jatrophihabitans sp. YIM 134969]